MKRRRAPERVPETPPFSPYQLALAAYARAAGAPDEVAALEIADEFVRLRAGDALVTDETVAEALRFIELEVNGQ